MKKLHSLLATFRQPGIMALFLLIVLTAFQFPSEKNGLKNESVAIYGIVYSDRCNTETYQYFHYMVVESFFEQTAITEMHSALSKAFPGARKVDVLTSNRNSEYNPTSMCAIKWFCYGKACVYEQIAVGFGNTPGEALNDAKEQMKIANTSKTDDFTVVAEKSWH